MFLKSLFSVLLAGCAAVAGSAQIIDTQSDPPALLFKDASAKTAVAVPLDSDHHVLVLDMKISGPANTAYVVNATGKSSKRSVSAVNLATLKVDRVIELGESDKVKLSMSRDGHRLFCYQPREDEKKEGSAPSVAVIDTASNEIIGKFELLDNPHLKLPAAKFIGTGLFSTTDGRFAVLGVDGYQHANAPAKWHRFVVFPVQSPNSAFVLDPGKPVVSLRASHNDKFLYVALGEKRRTEQVDIVNLETGSIVSRPIDDPPDKGEQLGAFLQAAQPASATSNEGIWVFTHAGMRYLSATGEFGLEIALPREEDVAAMLSLDRSLLIMALPNESQHNGELNIINLKDGTSTSHHLEMLPRSLVRLGPPKWGLWVLGNEEMRPMSETGDLGDRAIQLNKPRKMDAAAADAGGAFLDGAPGAAISLGEDRAAILIINNKGGSLHRVGLLDLKQYQLDGVVQIRGAFSKTGAGRWLTALGTAAAEGAIEGVVTGATRTPTNLFTPYFPGGAGNEALTASRDGKNLYVLNTDTHELSVIDVQAVTIARRIEVDHSATAIHIAPDGKHLWCIGKGVFQTLDLEGTSNLN